MLKQVLVVNNFFILFEMMVETNVISQLAISQLFPSLISYFLFALC